VLERSNNRTRPALQAARRDTLVRCPERGREVERASRQQKYCSRRCREQAHYEKLAAEGRFNPAQGGDTALPTDPIKNSNGFNDLQARKLGSSPRIYAPRRVIEAELIAGYEWRPVTSPHGVAVLVAPRLRRRPR
jgi:hypothetical protein